MDKNGKLAKPEIGEEDVLIQTGEVIEILSGGIIKSTPHKVVQPRSQINRITFALFMEPSEHMELANPRPQH